MLGLPDSLTAEQYWDALGGGAAHVERGSAAESGRSGPGLRRGCDGVARPWDSGQPGLGASGQKLLERDVARRIEEHQRRYGTTPAGWRRWAAEILEPTVSWQRLLASAIRRGVADVAGRVDFSYRKPSRRSSVGGDVILPSLRQPLPKVAMVLDTSGSMDDHLLAQSLAEVDGVLRSLGVGRRHLQIVCCDAKAFEAQKVMRARDVELLGGGGTDMGAGLTKAAALRPRPDLIVVLTDGHTPWPPTPPRGIRVIVGLMDPSGHVPEWAKAIAIDDGERGMRRPCGASIVMQTGIDVAEPDDHEPEELARWLAAGFTGRGRRRLASLAIHHRPRTGVGRGGSRRGLARGPVVHGRRRPPTPSRSGAQVGIGPGEAVRWHEFGYGLEAARTEKAKGPRPRRGLRAGPSQRAAPPTARMATRSRVGHRLSGPPGGFAGPLRGLHEAGVDPRLIHSYMQHQWMDESAVAWATQGIDAVDAYMWHELGLTPAEAGRLELQGRTVGDVVREWWSAGIPFEEFADWIGAGLSAAEAVEQRARGITAEHAASLRALRQDDPPQVRPGGRAHPLFARSGPPGSEQIGPPPEDEEAARAKIGEAFSHMMEGDDASNAIPTVDRSEDLCECLQEAAQRNAAAAADSTATITVDLVRFLNDHEARVSYSVVVSGGHNVTFRDRPGKAVLVGGVWKVDRDTFCQMMQLAGVQCPPRPGG